MMAKRAKKDETPQVMWVRVGFEDDYHPFIDVESVAQYLNEFYDLVEVFRHDEFGVTAEGFTGNNFISLFWGTDPTDRSGKHPEMTRPLTHEEIVEINDSLEACAECQP